MLTSRNPRISTSILEALYDADRPYTRSDLAGAAQLTIKQLSLELERLVMLGVVRRTEEPHGVHYTLNETYATNHYSIRP